MRAASEAHLIHKKRMRKLRRARFNQQAGRCFWCGGQMEHDPAGPYGATLEHLLPKSLGGTDDAANIVVAHRRCNEERATMDAMEFMERKRAA